MGATGLEPVTPSVSSKGVPDVSKTGTAFTAAPSAGYTSGYTTSPDPPPKPTLETLAVSLMALSADERAQLAAMLLGLGDKTKRES